MADTHSRTVIKTVIWRLFCFASTYTLMILFGQGWQKATVFSTVLGVFLTVTYYVYERLWSGIHWGQKR